MPLRIHRFYLDDREPGQKLDEKTVQKIMKDEIPEGIIRVWKVEDRTQYKGKSPDQPGLSLRESVTVIAFYIKEECNRVIDADTRAETRTESSTNTRAESRADKRPIKSITIPFDDPNPTDKKVLDAVKKALGEVKIINWSKVNQVQNSSGVGRGKYQVFNKSEIVVRYMGGNNGHSAGNNGEAPQNNGESPQNNSESADKNGKKHRLLFRHNPPDGTSVRNRMLEEVGQCTVLRWYKDEELAKMGASQPGMTRVIVEYKQ